MKKTLLITSLLSISTLLTACETRKPIYGWYQKGVSAEHTETEFAECQYEVVMNKLDVHREKEILNACMKKKGFRWQIINR